MTLEICPCHFLGKEGARQRPRIDGIGFEGLAILGAPISDLDGVSVDLRVEVGFALGRRRRVFAFGMDVASWRSGVACRV